MPFKIYSTRPGFYYAYDMVKNSILKISKENYYELQELEKGVRTEKNQSVLQDFQKKGYLLDSPIEKIQHPATEHVEYQMNRSLRAITLQMSQNCNLRCEYCPYCDNGLYDNRKHDNKNMSWETITRAIDFLIEHSVEAEYIYISYYGGEPLLNKKLLIDSMRYAVENVSGKIVKFGMTTNGTLLDDDFLAAISEFDVTITISLDGPEEIHDTHRKFSNGKGSYEIVRKNIKNIQENYPKLARKLDFNTVVSPDIEFKKIWEFFGNKDNFSNFTNTNLSTLSTNYTTKDIEYGKEYFEEVSYMNLRAYLYLLGFLPDEDAGMHRSVIERIYKYSEIYTPKTVPKIAHPNGTCIPGLKKLFVDVWGNLYPCERADENSEFLRIGTIYKGFDFEKVRYLLNVAATTENKCKNCWAFYGCTMCPVAADTGKDNKYKNTYMNSKCIRIKQAALEALKDYTMLRELKFRFYREGLENARKNLFISD